MVCCLCRVLFGNCIVLKVMVLSFRKDWFRCVVEGGFRVFEGCFV